MPELVELKKFFSIGHLPNGKYIVYLNWPIPELFASAEQDSERACHLLIHDFVNAVIKQAGLPVPAWDLRIYPHER